MAIRKNMRHMGAATRTKRRHEDKRQLRYTRTLQKPWGPLVVSAAPRGETVGVGHELHRGGSNMAALDCIFITHAHMLSQTEIEEKH